MKKVNPLLTVLTVLIFAGAFFTAGFYNQDENESSSATEQFDGDGAMKEQSAGTEGGTTKRHIDISDPFTGAYLREDMKIEGEAEVKESFTMGNVDAGANVEASVGEEGETKDASADVNSGSSEGEVESAHNVNGEDGRSGVEESNNKEKPENQDIGETKKYKLEFASIPEWADLF